MWGEEESSCGLMPIVMDALCKPGFDFSCQRVLSHGCHLAKIFHASESLILHVGKSKPLNKGVLSIEGHLFKTES